MALSGKPPPVRSVSEAERIARIERWTRFLDEAYALPGTKYRVGWDSIIGLVPVLGDAVMAGFSAYLIYEARQAGASKWIMTRMIGNVGIDFLVGSIPVLGNVFDVAWKANRRNARLLKRYLEQARK